MRGKEAIPRQQAVGVGEPGVGQRVPGVLADRPLEVLDAPCDSGLAACVLDVAALHVELVRVDVLRVAFDRLRMTLGRKPALERRDDGSGDLVLNREDVLHLAVVALGPEVVPVGDVDQLRRHAQTVARLPHAAFEDGLDVQSLPDGPNVRRGALELKR